MDIKNRYTEKYNHLNEPELGELDVQLLGFYQAGKLNDVEMAWFKQIIFDKLFHNEWDAEQTVKIKKLLASNADLRLSHHNFNEAMKFIETREAYEYRQMVRKELDKPGSSKQWYYYAAAALIILLLSIAYSLFFVDRSDINQQLYADYYEPYGVKLRNTRTGQGDNNLNSIYTIPDEKIDSAISVFQGFINDDPGNFVARMNLAGIYMESQEFTNAIAQYEKVILNEKSKYYENALWYLALCYLHQDHPKRVDLLLNKIVILDGQYKDKAVSLIQKIK